MTVRPKTELLLRDIAKLVIQYRADDWEPILAELRAGGDLQHRIAKLVELLLMPQPRVSRRRPKTNAKKAKTSPSLGPASGSSRRLAREAFYEAIKAKELLPGLKNVRGAYLHIGGKEVLPSKRSAAVEAVIEFMERLDDAQFRKAVEILRSDTLQGPRDPRAEYAQWFALIQSEHKPE